MFDRCQTNHRMTYPNLQQEPRHSLKSLFNREGTTRTTQTEGDRASLADSIQEITSSNLKNQILIMLLPTQPNKPMVYRS